MDEQEVSKTMSENKYRQLRCSGNVELVLCEISTSEKRKTDRNRHRAVDSRRRSTQINSSDTTRRTSAILLLSQMEFLSWLQVPARHIDECRYCRVDYVGKLLGLRFKQIVSVAIMRWQWPLVRQFKSAMPQKQFCGLRCYNKMQIDIALEPSAWGHYICAVFPTKTEESFVSSILSRH